ncbi:hypothetical protein BC829DRAFT_196230 [Chytridium lagenaria]|nr:hypothetical protein BC829DRAFT_196230 [Chytridium lagenaria]
MAQGRLYVTSQSLYFASSVFGTFKMSIAFANITSIQKHKLVGVIPNAILVVDGQNKHIFHNFLSRDAAFDLFCKLWSIQNPNSAVAVFTEDFDKPSPSSNPTPYDVPLQDPSSQPPSSPLPPLSPARAPRTTINPSF